MKRKIKLTEGDLRRIVKRSVNTILREELSDNNGTISVWSDKDSDVEVYKEFTNISDAISWATELVHGRYYNNESRIILNVGVIYETLDNYDEMNV